MILHGSRESKGGLKVSYHVIFPWFVFPCNDTTLRTTVSELSLMPEFQYQTRDGTTKPFIDPGVYTKKLARIVSSDS